MCVKKVDYRGVTIPKNYFKVKLYQPIFDYLISNQLKNKQIY